jgi:hypothetical protein
MAAKSVIRTRGLALLIVMFARLSCGSQVKWGQPIPAAEFNAAILKLVSEAQFQFYRIRTSQRVDNNALNDDTDPPFSASADHGYAVTASIPGAESCMITETPVPPNDWARTLQCRSHYANRKQAEAAYAWLLDALIAATGAVAGPPKEGGWSIRSSTYQGGFEARLTLPQVEITRIEHSQMSYAAFSTTTGIYARITASNSVQLAMFCHIDSRIK